jgi:alpha-tubulin suppressor-like RCC1 family protein
LNPTPIVGLTSGVTAIAAGGYHNLAVQNGAVYAWGTNAAGELGIGAKSVVHPAPVAAVGLTSGVTAVAAGFYHSLALQNGHVYAWGENGNGQLGDGTQTDQPSPELIDPSDLNNIIAISAGYDSSYALSSDGSLWIWGDNGYRQLGLPLPPVLLLSPQHLLAPAGYKFTSISGDPSGYHTLATLSPVPEPASIAMLALGGMIVMQQLRRRAKHV